MTSFTMFLSMHTFLTNIYKIIPWEITLKNHEIIKFKNISIEQFTGICSVD